METVSRLISNADALYKILYTYVHAKGLLCDFVFYKFCNENLKPQTSNLACLFIVLLLLSLIE